MNMKRTMILLPAETHKRLRHLAVERETSMGQVVREAVDTLLREDREDLATAHGVLKSFKPGTGTAYETYRARRLRGSASAG
jgi:predicted DNA-binding protein